MVVREVEVDVEVLILAKNIHGFLKYQKYCYFELKKKVQVCDRNIYPILDRRFLRKKII